ncbi:MAG: phosphatase PAP2 family protein [Candidatus Lokiarchaeota archaeon]|nr:phosphatase PAP2 family protein [Candidatus Lokiarchaeota archaeon]
MSNIKTWSGIKKITFIVIITWGILAIIFGFSDLSISIAIVDEASIWGNFGADYGEIPGYALIAMALATLLGSLFSNLKMQKIPAYIGIIVGILFITLIGDESYINIGWSLIISLVLYVIISWNKDWKDFKKISAIIALLAVINPLLFVQITKILCGRIRFRDLAPGYINFTPWFLPPGISAGGSSFPSGHTAMGWMFLPLLIAVKDRENREPLRILTIILISGWGLFVGLSRIAVGAHYSSDVLFSTGVATIVTIFLYTRFYKQRSKSD